MKRTLIRIGIVVGIIVLAALAAWWFMGRTPAASPSELPSGSLAPLASVSALPITYGAAPDDWKTYSSASLGFSVKYPPDWTAQGCGQGCIGWASPQAPDQLALGVVKSTGTLATVLEQAQPYLADKQQVKVGANTWTKLTLQHPTTGDIITSHFIARGSSLFEFGTATENADVLAVYGTMISSFTFLK